MRRITVLITAGLLLNCVTTVFAYRPQHNLYLAANAGIFRADVNARYQDQTDVIAEDIAESSLQNGYTGGGAIGYSFTFSQFLLGIEALFNGNSDNARFDSGAANTAFTNTTSVKYHADIVVVPALFFNESLMAYLKLGTSYAHITDELTSPVGFNPDYIHYNSAENVWGFAFGIGLKKFVTPNIALFTEYNYHDYGNLQFSDFQNFTADYTHSARITTHLIVVGAAYYF